VCHEVSIKLGLRMLAEKSRGDKAHARRD
jgi:hypothetical protein